MNNDSFNFLSGSLNNTPVEKNFRLGRDTPSNYSLDIFNVNNNDSNKVSLNIIKDENKLKTILLNLESEILNYCGYYKSLEDIFNRCDIEIKNSLVIYVNEFNNNCKKYANQRTNKFMEAKKNSNEKNRLREELNQTKEYLDNLVQKHKNEIEEMKVLKQKEIEGYKYRLNKAEDQIKNLSKSIDKLNIEIKKKEKDLSSLREDYSRPGNSSFQDYITISYALDDNPEKLDIDIYGPKKQDFTIFQEKLIRSQKNFKTYVDWLVDTSNKALAQYKKIYFKIKGEECLEEDNSLKSYNPQTYNIDEELSWTNIMNIHETLTKILEKIFELVNPTKECDPKRLNEDSCDFLLNYIFGLRKLFFLQKEILDNYFFNNNFDEKNKNFLEFTKINQESEKFFKENNAMLKNQENFEKFKEVLKAENSEIISVDEYMKDFKSLLDKTKKISDERDIVINEYLNKLSSEINRDSLDEINMELSNSKNNRVCNNGL